MILRALVRLLSLAALAVAGWWIARLIGQARRRQVPPRDRPASREGSMVRDRVCNTFLPRSRAIEHRAGDTTHYFCSEDCLQRFIDGPEASKTA